MHTNLEQIKKKLGIKGQTKPGQMLERVNLLKKQAEDKKLSKELASQVKAITTREKAIKEAKITKAVKALI